MVRVNAWNTMIWFQFHFLWTMKAIWFWVSWLPFGLHRKQCFASRARDEGQRLKHDNGANVYMVFENANVFAERDFELIQCLLNPSKCSRCAFYRQMEENKWDVWKLSSDSKLSRQLIYNCDLRRGTAVPYTLAYLRRQLTDIRRQIVHTNNVLWIFEHLQKIEWKR